MHYFRVAVFVKIILQVILKSPAGRSGSVFISSIVALPCHQVSLLRSREGESRKRSEDGGNEAGGAKILKTK